MKCQSLVSGKKKKEKYFKIKIYHLLKLLPSKLCINIAPDKAVIEVTVYEKFYYTTTSL